MAIRDIVTRGFGNGTYSPGVNKIPTRGYSISSAVVPTIPGLEFNLLNNRTQFTMTQDNQHYRFSDNRYQYTIPKDK